MSPELKAALQAIKNWVDAGQPESDVFCKYKGICGNTFKYTASVVGWENFGVIASKVQTELQDILLEELGDCLTPFNSKTFPYWKEKNKFNNPARLAWLEENCK